MRHEIHARNPLTGLARCGRFGKYGLPLTDDYDAITCRTCKEYTHVSAREPRPGAWFQVTIHYADKSGMSRRSSFSIQEDSPQSAIDAARRKVEQQLGEPLLLFRVSCVLRNPTPEG